MNAEISEFFSKNVVKNPIEGFRKIGINGVNLGTGFYGLDAEVRKEQKVGCSGSALKKTVLLRG